MNSIENQFLEEDIKSLRINKSISRTTKINYLNYVSSFLEYLVENSTDIIEYETIDNFNWGNLDSRDVIKYFEDLNLQLQNNEIAESTFNHRLSGLKRFFVFLISLGIMENDPTVSILRVKRPPRIIDWIPLSTVNKILNEFTKDKIENRAILEVMFSTGLSLTELFNCTIEDYDSHNSVIRIISNDAESKHYLIDRAQLILEEYLQFHRVKAESKNLMRRKNWLFLRSKSGKQYSERTIQHQLTRIGKKYGIENLNPRLINYSLARFILNQNVNPKIAEKLTKLGKESIWELIEDPSEEEMKEVHESVFSLFNEGVTNFIPTEKLSDYKFAN